MISAKNIEVLMAYVETDVMNPHKQATAFSLLKALIGRQFVHPKIKELVWQLAESAVLSQQPQIRLQCRQVSV